MKLNELIVALQLTTGRAWSNAQSDPPHEQEDPMVWLVDEWGGKHAISEVRLDFAPETPAEAEANVRHPVVEIYPVFGDRA